MMKSCRCLALTEIKWLSRKWSSSGLSRLIAWSYSWIQNILYSVAIPQVRMKLEDPSSLNYKGDRCQLIELKLRRSGIFSFGQSESRIFAEKRRGNSVFFWFIRLFHVLRHKYEKNTRNGSEFSLQKSFLYIRSSVVATIKLGGKLVGQQCVHNFWQPFMEFLIYLSETSRNHTDSGILHFSQGFRTYKRQRNKLAVIEFRSCVLYRIQHISRPEPFTDKNYKNATLSIKLYYGSFLFGFFFA